MNNIFNEINLDKALVIKVIDEACVFNKKVVNILEDFEMDVLPILLNLNFLAKETGNSFFVELGQFNYIFPNITNVRLYFGAYDFPEKDGPIFVPISGDFDPLGTTESISMVQMITRRGTTFLEAVTRNLPKIVKLFSERMKNSEVTLAKLEALLYNK